jgi:hypothetical protein
MINELVSVFEGTVDFVRRSVADLSEPQMVEQPAGAPNHGMWTLGHLVFSCQGVAVELGAEPWLPEDWESRYGYGSTPSPDPSGHPSKPEMLELLADSAGRLRETLLGLTGADLARPLPDETLPTMGHLLLQVVGAHTAFHAGQLALWRRALGKPSVGVFV